MCDYQCDEKLGKVRAETRKAKAEIERITREHGAYLGQIETLHFMEKITGDIAPVGSYCSCDAMKRLLDAAGYLADINYFAATISESKATAELFRELRRILWGMELVPKRTTAVG
ncbi:MAG: hypothetical protein AAB487_03310 [Patescibacteria group bacterium]